MKRVHRLVEHLRGDGMSEESVQNLLKDQVLLSRMAAANGDAREEAEAIGIAMASLDERRATRIEELETEILEQKKARQIDKLKIAGLEVRLVEQQSEASKWKGLTILAQEQHNESADKTDEMPHGLVKDATRRPSSNLRVLAVNFVLPTLAIIVAAWIASLAEVFGARLFVYAIVVLAPIGGWVLWPRQKWWIIGVSAFILIIFAGLTVLGRGNLG
ncbi:hypothetical protein IIA16_03985 [bacterium]|nr:hypothetical protein [bacterium]